MATRKSPHSRKKSGRKYGEAASKAVASAGGALLGKSYHLSSEVYLAMLSRGFRGLA